MQIFELFLCLVESAMYVGLLKLLLVKKLMLLEQGEMNNPASLRCVLEQDTLILA